MTFSSSSLHNLARKWSSNGGDECLENEHVLINDIHFTEPAPGRRRVVQRMTTVPGRCNDKSFDRAKSFWAGRRQEGRAESSGDGSSRVGRHRPAIKALSHRGVDVTRR